VTSKDSTTANTSTLIREAIQARTSDARWKRVSKLHQLGSKEVFAAASRLLSSRRAVERELGADVLGQLGVNHSYPFKAASVPRLRRLIREDENPDVAAAALQALGHLGAWQALVGVGKMADHPDSCVRLALAQALAAPDDPCPQEVIDLLVRLTTDRNGDVRDWACFALGTQCSADGTAIRDALAARIQDRRRDCREEAILGLARRRDPRAVGPLLWALTSKSVGRLSVEAAAYMGDVKLLTPLRALTGWWRVDTALLETAIARCDPESRHAHEIERGRSLRRFRRMFIAAAAHIEPAVSIRTVQLPEDPDDYFLHDTLKIAWYSGAGEETACWHWPGLMERASGRVAMAARLAAEDLFSPGHGGRLGTGYQASK
jgi:HEAT repeat protein